MNVVVNLCQQARERLATQLDQASDEWESCQIYSDGFDEFRHKLLPALLQLAATEAITAPGYVKAQQALLQHLSWLTANCRRSCPDFPACAQVFNRAQQDCTDLVVQKELQRLAAAPVNVRITAEPPSVKPPPLPARPATSPVVKFAVGSILLVGLLVLVGRCLLQEDLRPVAVTAPLAGQQSTPVAEPLPVPPPPPEPAPAQRPLPAAEQPGIYRYTDDHGIPHFVKSLQQVPAEYRARTTFTPTQLPVTPVIISNNQVLVPVELRHGEVTVSTYLLLDPKVSITTISEQLAARLQLGLPQSQSDPATSPEDGRSARAESASIDRLAVGDQSQAPAAVMILSGSWEGREGEGQLGLSFLREHRYELDLEQSVIRWK